MIVAKLTLIEIYFLIAPPMQRIGYINFYYVLTKNVLMMQSSQNSVMYYYIVYFKKNQN